MASVCLYFQVHQPYRLRRYSVFDTGRDYWDVAKGAELCRRAAERSYLPAARVLLDAVAEHGGRFRFGLSATGVALEQLRAHAPDVVRAFQSLAATGCVEFLAEPYHHSLSFLYSPDEFRDQVAAQAALVADLFGQAPRAFRNAELIYSNDVAAFVAGLGFGVVLTEGAERVLGTRGPNHVYRPPGAAAGAAAGPKLLLRNARLSEDVAARFGDRMWNQWPVTADKFARWVDQVNGHGEVCNLFLDLAAFGEHQPADTGIFDFLRHLPGEVLRLPGGANRFVTPAEAADAHEPAGELDVPNPISWADGDRDLSAWLGNAMQSNALHELYRLEPAVKARNDPDLLTDWRRLTSSDHFHYMSTRYRGDAAARQVFNPYESPYDSYINFMNVLDNVQSRLREPPPAAVPSMPDVADVVASVPEAGPADETGVSVATEAADAPVTEPVAGDVPPADVPPADVPPADVPPADAPSVDSPAAESAPAAPTPSELPPVEPPPAEPALVAVAASNTPSSPVPIADAPTAEVSFWESVFVGEPAANDPPLPPTEIRTEDEPPVRAVADDDLHVLPQPSAAPADAAVPPAGEGG